MKRESSVWRPLFCGIAVGALGIAPGVSGGALAASFGYYELLLFAAAHPVKAFRQSAKTLGCLAVGIGAGIVLFGRILLMLFETYPSQMRCAVAGFILGSLCVTRTDAYPALSRMWRWGLTAMAFFLGLTLFYGNGFLQMGTPTAWGECMLCGGIYAVGTVVPGVSASCILLSMGAYEGVLAIIAGDNLPAVLPFLVGFAGVTAGLVCIVNYLYRRFGPAVDAAVTGFVAASIFPVIPPLSADKIGGISVLCGLGGLGMALWTQSKSSRKAKTLYN